MDFGAQHLVDTAVSPDLRVIDTPAPTAEQTMRPHFSPRDL
jgi:hypothetical protein